MKYNIDLFIKIIYFIVRHNDEPELYKRFSNIVDFLDNLMIDGKTLRNRWQEVEYINDDGLGIDYTQEPEKQFSVINGRIAYKP